VDCDGESPGWGYYYVSTSFFAKGEAAMSSSGKNDKGKKEQKKKPEHNLKEKRKLKNEKKQKDKSFPA
jgi:hypothetical protein